MVRRKRAFVKIIQRRGLELRALVAFSGVVEAPNHYGVRELGKQGKTVPEASENPGLHGQDLATAFAQDGQHFLFVANKYQTGFDQPLLAGRTVDKALSGIAAVQILEYFKTYYTAARIAAEFNPDLVANLIKKLEYQAAFTWAEANAAERFEHTLEAVSRDPALQQQAANIRRRIWRTPPESSEPSKMPSSGSKRPKNGSPTSSSSRTPR